MTFKVLIASACAFASLASHNIVHAQDQAPSPTEALDTERLELARQIVDLGFPEETREDIFFGTMDQMLAQTREATLRAYDLTDEGAIAVLDQWIADYANETKVILRSHIPSLIEATAKSYSVVFTRQELEDILAFVSTPSGQRFFEMSSVVFAEPNFAAANQAYMNESQALLPSALQDLIERLQSHFAERLAGEKQTES